MGVDVLSRMSDWEISHRDFTQRRYTDTSESKETSNMLRITVIENESEQRWVLQGRLTGVTCIDKEGEQVLLMMIKDGAKLVATGLYTKHLLESLSTNVADSSNRH